MKTAVVAGWQDVPHLDEQAKADLLKTYRPEQRKARTEGIPHMGAGSIYPVAEEDILCAPREIPAHWPRVFGLDVGWKTTAAVFAALDRDTGTVYVYDVIYRHTAEPVVVAADIKRKGAWIPGVIDPAANGRSQKDGSTLLDMYVGEGLDLEKADNTVETGIFAVWQRLSTGGLKIFRGSATEPLMAEMRIYRRNEQGKVVKSNDHALDALRYLIMSGLDRATTEPAKPADGRRWYHVTPNPIFAG